ncbi:hypothetical protein, partial [Azospirillum sp. SYSU D00513]|uniref:hypothetical protein n=1 Tax=Azospirillum sp. SYSU D00513 TaxID=2812561 RepID=UPI001A97C20A
SGTGPASTANKAAACASLLTTRSSLLKDPAALGAAFALDFSDRLRFVSGACVGGGVYMCPGPFGATPF